MPITDFKRLLPAEDRPKAVRGRPTNPRKTSLGGRPAQPKAKSLLPASDRESGLGGLTGAEAGLAATRRTVGSTQGTVRSSGDIDRGDGVFRGAAPAPVDTTTLSPTVAGDAPELAAARALAVEKAMSAIEARFGLDRETLLADQSEIGDLYRLLNLRAERERVLAVEQTQEAALERGLFRSGIHAEEQGRVAEQFADLTTDLAREESQRLADIQRALAGLEAEEEQEKVSTAVGILGGALDSDKLRALLEG